MCRVISSREEQCKQTERDRGINTSAQQLLAYIKNFIYIVLQVWDDVTVGSIPVDPSQTISLSRICTNWFYVLLEIGWLVGV